MIFDNEVQPGQIITSTIWNRAWGFQGTARSVYNAIGAQQSGSQQYSSGSWSSGLQNPTSTVPVQFSFISTTYQSNYKEGDFLVWSNGFSVANNLREKIIIQRNGFYAIQVEVGISDEENRFGNSVNADGTGLVPDISMQIFIEINDENVSNDKRFYRIPNTVKAATGNAPQLVQPYYSAFANFIIPLAADAEILLYAFASDESIRTQRIVHACLKAHLIKAL